MGESRWDLSAPLFNGAHYYAAQSLNGCPSESRLEVLPTIIDAPSTQQDLHFNISVQVHRQQLLI